ncbi:hypothetical protein AAG906_007573 [Vitis piasezkii]
MHDTSLTKGNLYFHRYTEMVIRSNAKHLTTMRAKVVLLLVADKKEMVVVDLNMYSFVMPDVPCQPNDNDCGVFIMKFMDNWSNGGLSKSIDVKTVDASGYRPVSDRSTKPGRPVNKPSTGIRPDHVRSMLFTRPGSHHPRPVTHSHWERENVKNTSDRSSTGHDRNNQPLGKRECRKCARPQPMIDRQSTSDRFLDRSHTLGREKMTSAIATGDQPVEVLRSTGRYTWRAFLRPVELLLTLFLL